MPKIIENLKERLLAEARKQISDVGYAAMTVRSVAAACGVGVGTVYNYFPSKEVIVATYLLEDWENCLCAIRSVGDAAKCPQPLLRYIYDQLRAFSEQHRAVFQDKTAAAGFSGSFSRYHALLRSQLAAPLRKFCDSDFSAEFIAESLLAWTMAGKDFDELSSILNKLFS